MVLQRSRIVQTHAPTLGRNVDVYVARLPVGSRAKPADQVLTVATAGAAKGATSITVDETIASVIAANQYLLFADENGGEYIAQLDTQVSSGSELSVLALPEAIPAGAVAEFPTYLWDRQNADLDQSYNRTTFATFNTGGDEDGIVVGASRSITAPGIYWFKNAGMLTAEKAADDGAEIWMQLVYPVPSSAYSAGKVVEGPASVTAAPETAGVDGFIQKNLTIAFNGSVTKTDPTPTA